MSEMKTFKEFHVERHGAWPGPKCMHYSDLFIMLCDSLADYVDTAMGKPPMPPPTQWAYDQACKALHKHRAEAERLRDVIDCGTNAITDALQLCRPDIERVRAMVRRMRREREMGETRDFDPAQETLEKLRGNIREELRVAHPITATEIHERLKHPAGSLSEATEKMLEPLIKRVAEILEEADRDNP